MKDAIQTWLTEQFGEDTALHDELYGQYAAEMKTLSEKLDAAVVAGDVSQLASIGHTMKGMALQMGDKEISDPCFDLQKAGQAGDLAASAALVPTITAFVAAL